MAGDAVEATCGLWGTSQALVGRGRELEQLDAALSDAIARRGGLVARHRRAGHRQDRARAGVRRARRAARRVVGVGDLLGRRRRARVLAVGADRARARRARGRGDAARRPRRRRAVDRRACCPSSPARSAAGALPSDLNADQARFRLFDALAALLATVAERRPLVIVLDDLHWADASSVLALEFVAPRAARPADPRDRRLPPQRGARPRRASRRRSAASRARSRRLPLEGLGRDDVARLATARASGLGPGERGRLPPWLVAAVHDASAGNPFFVDELVQLLASQGRLHDDRAGRRSAAAARRRARHDPPPPRVAATTVAAAAARAAVIGGEFRLATLARVAGERAAGDPRAPRAAAARGRRRAADGPGRFAFVHALVRDTLLSDIGATDRARLHLPTAEAFEQVYGDDLEPHLAEIADHYLQAATAGGAQRAVAFARARRERAIGQFGYDEAAALYERAIEVAAALPATSSRLAAAPGARRGARPRGRHRRRVPRAGQGGRPRAPPRRSATARDDRARARAARLLAGDRRRRLRRAARRGDRAHGRARPADRARAAADDALRCRLRVQLALALFWSPERERRERLVDEALEFARMIYSSEIAHSSPAQRMLADRTLAFVLGQGFLAVWGPDTVERGLPISVEALELCERTNDAELAMQVRLWRISLLLELDDPVRADAEIEAYGETARRLGQPRTLVYDPLHRAMRAQLRGELAEAERFMAEAAERARGVRGSTAPIAADMQLFLLRRTQGRQAELEPLLRRNADRLPAMPDWRCALALVLAESGRAEEARKQFEAFAASDFGDIPRGATWLPALSMLAELCALLDDAPRARPPVRPARAVRGPQRRVDRRRLPRPGRALPRAARDDGRRRRARARASRDRALGGGAHERQPDRGADGARHRRGARAPRCAGRRAARRGARAERRRRGRAPRHAGRGAARRATARAPRCSLRRGAPPRAPPAAPPSPPRPRRRAVAPPARRLDARLRGPQRLPAGRQGPAPSRDAAGQPAHADPGGRTGGRRSPPARPRASSRRGGRAPWSCARSSPRRAHTTTPSASARAAPSSRRWPAASKARRARRRAAHGRARARERHARDPRGPAADRRARARARPRAAVDDPHRRACAYEPDPDSRCGGRSSSDRFAAFAAWTRCRAVSEH